MAMACASWPFAMASFRDCGRLSRKLRRSSSRRILTSSRTRSRPGSTAVWIAEAVSLMRPMSPSSASILPSMPATFAFMLRIVSVALMNLL